MYKEDQNIHFSCTQCGKCCEKPPRVNFYEMLDLSDKFIFQTAHHTMISHASNPLDKSLCEHYQIIGHTIMMPELEASLFYFIDFMPIPLLSYKTCPQLKDNMCQIYGQRPSSCRLSPFSAFYDEKDQWKTVNFFKEQKNTHQWDCSFEDKDSLIFKNNEIHSPALNALYNGEVANIREITDKYVEFLSLQQGDRKNEHFKSLFDAMQKNSLIITDTIFMLHAAIYFQIISTDVANKFIVNQKELIEKELAKATNLKNKENLQTSRFYKQMLETYNKVIKNNPFIETKSDSFEII